MDRNLAQDLRPRLTITDLHPLPLRRHTDRNNDDDGAGVEKAIPEKFDWQGTQRLSTT